MKKVIKENFVIINNAKTVFKAHLLDAFSNSNLYA